MKLFISNNFAYISNKLINHKVKQLSAYRQTIRISLRVVVEISDSLSMHNILIIEHTPKRVSVYSHDWSIVKLVNNTRYSTIDRL